MVDEVAQRLARLADRDLQTADEDPVFASPLGGHLDPSALRRRFVEATRRAGLRALPLHSLRHFFGSMAVNKASLVEVQVWMGHAHIQTTARYLHHRTQREDATLLAEAFAREAAVRDPYSTQHPESWRVSVRDSPAAVAGCVAARYSTGTCDATRTRD